MSRVAREAGFATHGRTGRASPGSLAEFDASRHLTGAEEATPAVTEPVEEQEPTPEVTGGSITLSTGQTLSLADIAPARKAMRTGKPRVVTLQLLDGDKPIDVLASAIVMVK